jgi:hypothetical protein
MYKEHLYKNLERELLLLKRLVATHVTESDLDYRPSDKTRSVIELMHYMSSLGSIMLRWYIKNDLDKEQWEIIRAEQAKVTLHNFAECIDKQLVDVRAYLDTVTEDDLMTMEVILPWKEKMPLGMAIINGPIKWLATYRMQLFVALKINGKIELATADAWVLERPAPAA